MTFEHVIRSSGALSVDDLYRQEVRSAALWIVFHTFRHMQTNAMRRRLAEQTDQMC